MNLEERTDDTRIILEVIVAAVLVYLKLHIKYFLQAFYSDDSICDTSDDELEVSVLFSSDASSDTETEPDTAEHSVISNFLETINSYSDKDFKKHFRVSRSTVNVLLGIRLSKNFY